MSGHHTVHNTNILPQVASELVCLLCQGLTAYSLTQGVVLEPGDYEKQNVVLFM